MKVPSDTNSEPPLWDLEDELERAEIVVRRRAARSRASEALLRVFYGVSTMFKVM